jgi:hypothetical protein
MQAALCNRVNTVCDLQKYVPSNTSNRSHLRRHACVRCRQTSTTVASNCRLSVRDSAGSVSMTQQGRSSHQQQHSATPVFQLQRHCLNLQDHAENAYFCMKKHASRKLLCRRMTGNAAMLGATDDALLALHTNALKLLIFNDARCTLITVGCVSA